MIKLLNRNIAFGVAVVAVSAPLLWTTMSFEVDQADRVFPQILLVFMCVLGIYIIVQELRSLPSQETIVAGGRFHLPLVVAASYPLIALEIGFYATTFVFLLLVPFIFLKGGADGQTVASRARRASVGLAFAAGVTVFLYASFTILLKFSMPEGLLI